MTSVHRLKRQKAASVLANSGQFDGSSYYPGRGQRGHGWVSRQVRLFLKKRGIEASSAREAGKIVVVLLGRC